MGLFKVFIVVDRRYIRRNSVPNPRSIDLHNKDVIPFLFIKGKVTRTRRMNS